MQSIFATLYISAVAIFRQTCRSFDVLSHFDYEIEPKTFSAKFNAGKPAIKTLAMVDCSHAVHLITSAQLSVFAPKTHVTPVIIVFD